METDPFNRQPSPEHYLPKEGLEEASEKITVGNTTLREMYESRRITESGLRRLIVEHQRGGNIERALAHELLQKELKYERDPLLSDDDSQQLAETTKAIDEMAQKAMQPSSASENLQAKTPPSPHHAKARQIALARSSQKGQTQRIVDTMLITLIVLLSILVVALWLSRR